MAAPTPSTTGASKPEIGRIDQLVVEGRPGQGPAATLQMAPRLNPLPNTDSAQSERDLIQREQKMAATVEAQIAQQAEMAQRLRRLEALQAELRNQLSPPSPPIAPTPAPAPVVPPAASDGSILPWIAGLAALLAAAAATLMWRWKTPAVRATPDDSPTQRAGNGTPSPTETTAAPVMLDLTLGLPPDPTPPLSLTPPPSDLDADEMLVAHDSVIELADIMLSFGRVQGAAQALEEFIEAHPKKSLAPWVKLLEVYQMGGLKKEFEALSQRMNELFNIATIPWDEFQDAMHAKPDRVEDVPHVFEQITTLWNTRDCLKYIDRLLRDNRAGTRQGFPIGVADDLVALQAILEASLSSAPPKSI